MSDEISLDKALVALLRLAVAEREERIIPELSERKTELLLDEVGLSYGQIATLVGKKPDAVRKTIARAKKKT